MGVNSETVRSKQSSVFGEYTCSVHLHLENRGMHSISAIRDADAVDITSDLTEESSALLKNKHRGSIAVIVWQDVCVKGSSKAKQEKHGTSGTSSVQVHSVNCIQYKRLITGHYLS